MSLSREVFLFFFLNEMSELCGSFCRIFSNFSFSEWTPLSIPFGDISFYWGFHTTSLEGVFFLNWLPPWDLFLAGAIMENFFFLDLPFALSFRRVDSSFVKDWFLYSPFSRWSCLLFPRVLVFFFVARSLFCCFES